MTSINPRDLRNRAILLGMVCAGMVVVHAANVLSGGYLMGFGIHPRDFASLPMIVTAPWLHADVAHLGNNLIALAVFGALTLMEGLRYFVKASVIIIIVSGLLLWLLGRDAVHLGASGWIFGLWSLTIVRAVYDRSYSNIAISLAVIFLYGGMAFGMLPTDAHISFEGHIFGALAGVLAARLLHRKGVALASDQSSPALKFWD